MLFPRHLSRLTRLGTPVATRPISGSFSHATASMRFLVLGSLDRLSRKSCACANPADRTSFRILRISALVFCAWSHPPDLPSHGIPGKVFSLPLACCSRDDVFVGSSLIRTFRTSPSWVSLSVLLSLVAICSLLIPPSNAEDSREATRPTSGSVAHQSFRLPD